MSDSPTNMSRRTLLGAAAIAPAVSLFANERPAKIRIGQIGTSHSHASGKMDAVRSFGDIYEQAGIAEPIVERIEGAKKQKAYANLRWMSEAELLADRSIEAVVIETTLEDSHRAALAALRAGKHIHLDKPGAKTHADFQAMRLEAQKRRLTVQMGYMLRYNPAFELLFRAQQAGRLGEITEIDASMGKLADAGLLKQLAALPGHGMFELACHVIDIVVKLLGSPSDVHPFGKPTGHAPAGLNDHQLALLEYPKAMVTVRCNHGDPFGGPHRRFYVAGTKGAMEIVPLESGRGKLLLSAAAEEFSKGENLLSLKVPAGRYDGEFLDFARVVRGEKELAWSAEHDIAVHATVMRAAGLKVE